MMTHSSPAFWYRETAGTSAASTRRQAVVPAVDMHDRQVPGLAQSAIIILACSVLMIGMAFGICDRLVDAALTHLLH